MCVYFENVASRSQLVKDRNKDRSRSKSPFRSFRWKKSPQKSPLSAVSASDDEATVEPTSGIVVLNMMRRYPWYVYLLECKSCAWSWAIPTTYYIQRLACCGGRGLYADKGSCSLWWCPSIMFVLIVAHWSLLQINQPPKLMVKF